MRSLAIICLFFLATSSVFASDKQIALSNFQSLCQTIENYNASGWIGHFAFYPISSDKHNDILQEYGVNDLVSKTFMRGQRQVVCQIYCFDTSEGAYGAYKLFRKGATTVVVNGDASSEDERSLSFWQDNYFVQLSCNEEDDDEIKEMMQALATQISASISEHTKIPAIILNLPQLDRVIGSEKLIMGPVVAKKILSIPYVGALVWTKECRAAVAEYQLMAPNQERLQLIIIDYDKPELAFQNYNDYCKQLHLAHQPEATGTTQLFRLANSYLYCQVKGKQMAIVSGAHKKQSPLFLIKQLDWITQQTGNN